jgi:hypothetical protein
MGKKGSRNCRVMGIDRPVKSAVATIVFINGPGCSIMHKLKMPTTAKNRYCASCLLQ